MILQSNSTKKGYDYIDKKFNPIGGKPVWVKIGRLYACVTITGDTSWSELLNEQSVADTRSVLIFTGRHGEVCGTIFESGQIYGGHGKGGRTQVQEDIDKCKVMRDKYPSIYLEVVDAFQGNLKKPDILREFTLGKLKSGNVVVWAWCNSLYTLQILKYTPNPDNPDQTLMREASSKATILLNETIDTIVRRDFQWVPV